MSVRLRTPERRRTGETLQDSEEKSGQVFLRAPDACRKIASDYMRDKAKSLVVGDDPDFLLATSRLLREAGYDGLTAFPQGRKSVSVQSHAQPAWRP